MIAPERYSVKAGKRYKRDVRRLAKSHADLARLETVIDLLLADSPLPAKYQDHELKGELRGTRECHIGPDWLLLYKKEKAELLVILLRTGSHRQVLGIE